MRPSEFGEASADTRPANKTTISSQGFIFLRGLPQNRAHRHQQISSTGAVASMGMVVVGMEMGFQFAVKPCLIAAMAQTDDFRLNGRVTDVEFIVQFIADGLDNGRAFGQSRIGGQSDMAGKKM